MTDQRQSSYRGRSQQTRTEERPNQARGQQMPPTAGAGNQAPSIAKPHNKQKLFEKFGEKFGVDPDTLVDVLKATCFRGQRADAAPVTNEQLVALLIVADQYGLNPFTKEIYAYPDKNGGIVPVVSVDGWIRIINEHPQFNGLEIRTPDAMITDESGRKYKHKPCWEWMEVTIFRKDRYHNQPIVEFFDEVYRPSLNLKNQNTNEWYEVPTPWQSHTKRLMRHKSIIQAGRVTFGFAGIYDDDEAQRILDDEKVVLNVPPGQSRNDTAKEALRARQGQQSAQQPRQEAQRQPEQQRPAQQQSAQQQARAAADDHSEATAPPAEDEEIPWEGKQASSAKTKTPQTPEEWAQAMKAAAKKSRADLDSVWDECLTWHDAAGKEISIDIEAVFQLLTGK